MKTLVILAMLSFVTINANAFDTVKNPDRFTSFGLDISRGNLPGTLTTIAQGAPSTDGGFVKGTLDIRVPVTNTLTLHAFGSSTGVNNNVNYSAGSEVGFGMRVYLQ